MQTQLNIDEDLINEALQLGHFKTREDTVITALREFIQRRKQQEIIQLSAHSDSNPDCDEGDAPQLMQTAGQVTAFNTLDDPVDWQRQQCDEWERG